MTLIVAACGPDALDGDDGGDEVGDGAEDEGDDGGALDEACPLGCAHVLDCAPGQFGSIYPDVDTCVEACEELYTDCVPEALDYFDCIVSLDCAEVPGLLTEGPSTTVCGPSFETAETACGR